MGLRVDSAQAFGFFAVIVCWLALCALFFLQKRKPRPPTAKRAPAARWGMALQGAAFFSVWLFQRWNWPLLYSVSRPLQDALSLAAIPMAITSSWLTVSAIRTLGKQWSFDARLAEGHRLIVAGPYSHMRHPIYTAMLGMMLATGLAVTYWPIVAAATLIFCLGTAIRVRAEERLLRDAFGEDFEAYARYVPAILPRLRTSSASPKS